MEDAGFSARTVPKHVYQLVREYLRTRCAGWKIQTADFCLSNPKAEWKTLGDDGAESFVAIYADLEQTGDLLCRGPIARLAREAHGDGSAAVAILDSSVFLGHVALSLAAPFQTRVSVEPRAFSSVVGEGPASFPEVRALFDGLERFLRRALILGDVTSQELISVSETTPIDDAAAHPPVYPFSEAESTILKLCIESLTSTGIYPTISELANAAGCDERHVNRCLEKLRGLELLPETRRSEAARKRKVN